MRQCNHPPQIKHQTTRQLFHTHHQMGSRIHGPSNDDTENKNTYQRFHIHGVHELSFKRLTGSIFLSFRPTVRLS